MDNKLFDDEFILKMSHEFRTLILPILGYTDLLVEKVNDANIENILRTMQSNISKVINILDQIEYVVGIESRKNSINIKSLIFNGLLDELVKDLMPGLEKKGLYIRIHPGGTIYIDSDYNLLKIIMRNVLESTVQYTDKGGITIDYRTISHHKRLYLKIKITDTGMGISDLNMDEIFKSIKSGNDKTNSDNRKSGLKLSLTKKLIEKLGGEMRIESELGKGSGCLIQLPLK